MIYVIGHKNPDTDSVISAITYAKFLGPNYQALIAGPVNDETKFVLNKFNVEIPEIKEKAEDNEEFILVDHNEEKQRIENLTEEKIIEILDHHKMNFQNSKPIKITVLPWGSTASIIANKYLNEKIDLLDESTAGLLLSAILSDTVIFKSPTCTDLDKNLAEKLALIANVENIEEYGIQLFKEKSKLENKTAEEIINLDAKEFDFNGKKIIVAQVELIDSEDLEKRKEEILNAMKKTVEEKQLYSYILMVSNILKEGSHLWIAGNEEELKNKLEYNDEFLDKFLSRKKQMIPWLTEKL